MTALIRLRQKTHFDAFLPLVHTTCKTTKNDENGDVENALS